MVKNDAPLCGLCVCQQCSDKPKTTLRNGRKAPNPAAKALVRDLYAAVEADPELARAVVVKATRCHGACDLPIAWNLNSAHGEGWQFGGAGGKVSVADMLDVVRAYIAHLKAGTRSTKADWPASVGKMLVVRIPAFPRVAKWIRVPKG